MTKNKRLKLSVHSGVDTDYPASLTVSITPELAKRIKQLSRECTRLKVTYISEFEYSPTWGSRNDRDIDGSEWRIECSMLVVSDTDFHWTGILKHSSIMMESQTYPISKL